MLGEFGDNFYSLLISPAQLTRTLIQVLLMESAGSYVLGQYTFNGSINPFVRGQYTFNGSINPFVRGQYTFNGLINPCIDLIKRL